MLLKLEPLVGISLEGSPEEGEEGGGKGEGEGRREKGGGFIPPSSLKTNGRPNNFPNKEYHSFFFSRACKARTSDYFLGNTGLAKICCSRLSWNWRCLQR
jgi:hypothetical protein